MRATAKVWEALVESVTITLMTLDLRDRGCSGDGPGGGVKCESGGACRVRGNVYGLTPPPGVRTRRKGTRTTAVRLLASG